MKTLLTKYFPFSASFERGNCVIGHNYVLGVTTDFLLPEDENKLTETVTKNILGKIHSKDFSKTGFLGGVAATEDNILRAFYDIIRKTAPFVSVRRITLERDRRTLAELAP